MSELIISDLYKSYGKKQVINGMSVSIKPGIFGLLGPNGSGKTTLMKCIVTLLEDYKGKIQYSGIEWKKSSKVIELIGYLPQNFSLYKQLTVYEALEHISILKGVRDYKQKIEEILKQINLIDEKNKKIKSLSGGMLRRVGIAQALIGDPKILVIDEPTAGLDPKERVRFRNILSKLPKDKIVILSTHIVEDLSFIADSVAIIDKGRIIEHGNIADITSKLQGKVAVKTINISELNDIERDFIVTSAAQHGNDVAVRIVGDNLPKGGCIVEPTLEDMYFYLIGDKDE